jgi:hypothetical protein
MSMSCYVHNTPGRLRIKIPYLKDNADLAYEIRDILSEIDGIDRISINTVTGSIIVHYNADVLLPWQILQILKDNHYVEDVQPISHSPQGGGSSSAAGMAIGKALFGWAVGKAFEGSSLSFIAAFI